MAHTFKCLSKSSILNLQSHQASCETVDLGKSSTILEQVSVCKKVLSADFTFMMVFSQWVPLFSLSDFSTYLFFKFSISRKLIWNTNLHIVLPWVISSFCPSDNQGWLQRPHTFMAKSHFSSCIRPAALYSSVCLLLSKQPKKNGLRRTLSDLCPPLCLGWQAVQNKNGTAVCLMKSRCFFKTVCLSPHILSITPKESSHLLDSVCSVSKTQRFQSHYL